MRELYQRLKELDRDRFEQLCFHLLKAKYPTSSIRRVEGQAGDEGLDSFAGRLDGRPIVWQAKSFPNGIRDSQKNQIRKSLHRALKCVSPRQWILCTSIDFDSQAHRWYEKLTHKHKNRVQMDLMTASDFVHDLIYFTGIRESFFHGAIIDIQELHKMLAGRTGLSMADLAAVTGDNAEQYLRELEVRDSRFSYSVSFTRNRQPDATAAVPPGIIASVCTGSRKIDIFPRDLKALQLNPPQGKFTINANGIAKWNDFVRTGRPQHLGANELVSYESDFDFVLPEGSPSQVRDLYIRRTTGTLPPPTVTRITFGQGSGAIVYDFVELSVSALGTDEVELFGRGPSPFDLRLVINEKKSSANFELLDHYEGVDFGELAKCHKAIKQLSEIGYLEIFSLRHNAPLFKGTVDRNSFRGWSPHFARLVDAVAKIGAEYGVTLRFAEMLTDDDRRSLVLLEGLLNGIALPFSNLNFSTTKDETLDSALSRFGDGAETSFRAIFPEFPERLILYGVLVPTGPVDISIQKVRLADQSATLKQIREAAVGDTVSMSLECGSDAIVKRYVQEPT
jgi:hypothetical protein